MKSKNSFLRFKNSDLFKDSFWAVFGNGLGNGLMLFAGIIIARFLGRDTYGEYGLIKTTVLYIGAFSTMGLMTTSTKYIATAVKETPSLIKSLANDALKITLTSSGITAILFIVFAEPISIFLDEPDLSGSFRILGIIIIFRSLQLTQSGILGGLSKYNVAAKNNIISSLGMLGFAALFTYLWGLAGSLAALLISQILNTLLNYSYIQRYVKSLRNQIKVPQKKELLFFSFPVALQGASYTITHWAGTVILAKFSTLGQIGLFNAAAQWNAVVTMIPGLLVNVILSHLSRTVGDVKAHDNVLKKVLLCNLACTIIPFAVIYFLAKWISGFYGPTFTTLPDILRITIFSTIFSCCSNVFQSEFIAQSKTWSLFFIRLLRDTIGLFLCYYMIVKLGREEGAISYAISNVVVGIIYFIALFIGYYFFIRKKYSSV